MRLFFIIALLFPAPFLAKSRFTGFGSEDITKTSGLARTRPRKVWVLPFFSNLNLWIENPPRKVWVFYEKVFTGMDLVGASRLFFGLHKQGRPRSKRTRNPNALA